MTSKVRMAIAALAFSAAGLVGLTVREGYTDNAVIPVKNDVPTIGFGTTGGVKMGDKTTPVKALQRAMADIAKYEGALKQCITAPLSQQEYDLWVDFSYNVGTHGFCTSTIARRINAGQYRASCDAVLMWKYQKGYDCSTPGNRRCYGLWERRLETHAKCMAAQ